MPPQGDDMDIRVRATLIYGLKAWKPGETIFDVPDEIGHRLIVKGYAYAVGGVVTQPLAPNVPDAVQEPEKEPEQVQPDELELDGEIPEVKDSPRKEKKRKR